MSDGAPTPLQFRAFVDELDLHGRYPGIQGVGYTRVFTPGERATVEAEVRAAGNGDFHVWPDTPRPEMHAIVMLEPLDRRNAAAIGYDMFTDPTRREAMSRARDTGRPAASGPVTLVQELDQHKQAGFLIYVPLYRGGRTPATIEARRAALYGFLYSPFRADDLLAGVFGSETEPHLGFRIRDRDAPSALLHESAAWRPEASMRGASEIPIAGRTWALEFWTLPAFERSSSGWFWPYLFALGGFGAAVVFALIRRQARVRAQLLAREKTLRTQAEAASRTKDEFLAMLGHELRNPLAPIVTSLALLERSEARDAGTARKLAIISRQVTHLQRLVDDLLDVSAITRGKVKLEKRRVELDAVVRGAVELVRPLVDERRHFLRVDVEPALFVDADEGRLVQIVGNLLNNAAKYTNPAGHLEVVAAREGDDCVVRVRDDGPGIAPEALERLFGLFEQGERGVDRAQGGLGIGLAVVRSLVQLHGGSVVGHSDGEGRGSEFVVRLPAVAAPEGAEESSPTQGPATEVAPTAARRVLVVDDNADSAETLAELLARARHEVRVAHTAEAALTLAAAHRFDVAVLDIGLPGMSGHELGRKLCEGADLTLVAVSGYGQERDRELSRAAGFAHHFVKPVRPAEVLDAVAAAPRRSG